MKEEGLPRAPKEVKASKLSETIRIYVYIGSEVCQTAKVEREVMVRLRKAGTVYQMWRWKVFRSRNLSKTTKLYYFILFILIFKIASLLQY